MKSTKDGLDEIGARHDKERAERDRNPWMIAAAVALLIYAIQALWLSVWML